MTSDRTGATQTACRVLVAGGDDRLVSGHYVFDTGKMSSDISTGLRYDGDILCPSTRCFWKVQVWDESSNMLKSEPS
jgi:hypothetical protein